MVEGQVLTKANAKDVEELVAVPVAPESPEAMQDQRSLPT